MYNDIPSRLLAVFIMGWSGRWRGGLGVLLLISSTSAVLHPLTLEKWWNCKLRTSVHRKQSTVMKLKNAHYSEEDQGAYRWNSPMIMGNSHPWTSSWRRPFLTPWAGQACRHPDQTTPTDDTTLPCVFVKVLHKMLQMKSKLNMSQIWHEMGLYISTFSKKIFCFSLN